MEGKIITQIEALYRAESGTLMRGLRAIQPDASDREEAVLYAFTALWRKLERGEEITDPPALLRTIAERRAKDTVRADVRRREYETPAGGLEALAEISDVQQLAALTGGRQPTYEALEFTAEHDVAVRALEEDERNAYILTELRGLTVREAADVLDTSKDTVQRRAESARQSIREEIQA